MQAFTQTFGLCLQPPDRLFEDTVDHFTNTVVKLEHQEINDINLTGGPTRNWFK